MRHDMSDDAFDLGIAAQLRDDLLAARLTGIESTGVVGDLEKRGCFSSVSKTALLQTRWAS